MKQLLRSLALLLIAAGASGTYAQQVPQKVTASLTTAAGELRLVQIGDEETSSDIVHFVQLDGKTIGKIGERHVGIHAYFAGMEAGDIIVLSAASGGNGCPSLFHVVQIESPEMHLMTEEFGDCSETPTITREGDQITLRFGGHHRLSQSTEPGFRPPPPTTYVFRAGRLREIKAAPARRRRK